MKEKNLMEIKDYVGIYDDLFEKSALQSLYRYAENQNKSFNEATINHPEGFQLQKDIRDTQDLALARYDQKLTSVHWHNYLCKCFSGLIRYYSDDKKAPDLKNLDGTLNVVLSDIAVLRYKNNGHYNYHTDNCTNIPRTLSIILMLNDDYEGGELVFANPQMNHEEIIVKPRKGRAIIWPSNFLYPHKVNFVTKGIRYSVVCWAR